MQSVCDIWRHLDTFENILRNLGTFDIWRHLVTFENVWKYLEPCDTTFGDILETFVDV